MKNAAKVRKIIEMCKKEKKKETQNKISANERRIWGRMKSLQMDEGVNAGYNLGK